MTLKELNAMLEGFPERCFQIFRNEEDMKNHNKCGEVWTQVSNGRGGFFSKWDDNPIINKEVVKFRASGWQSNVYYVILV